jgi:hypothetical protein
MSNGRSAVEFLLGTPFGGQIGVPLNGAAGTFLAGGRPRTFGDPDLGYVLESGPPRATFHEVRQVAPDAETIPIGRQP